MYRSASPSKSQQIRSSFFEQSPASVSPNNPSSRARSFAQPVQPGSPCLNGTQSPLPHAQAGPRPHMPAGKTAAAELPQADQALKRTASAELIALQPSVHVTDYVRSSLLEVAAAREASSTGEAAEPTSDTPDTPQGSAVAASAQASPNAPSTLQRRSGLASRRARSSAGRGGADGAADSAVSEAGSQSHRWSSQRDSARMRMMQNVHPALLASMQACFSFDKTGAQAPDQYGTRALRANSDGHGKVCSWTCALGCMKLRRFSGMV